MTNDMCLMIEETSTFIRNYQVIVASSLVCCMYYAKAMASYHRIEFNQILAIQGP